MVLLALTQCFGWMERMLSEGFELEQGENWWAMFWHPSHDLHSVESCFIIPSFCFTEATHHSLEVMLRSIRMGMLAIVLWWTIVYSIPGHAYHHITNVTFHWDALLLLPTAYVGALTYGGLALTGLAALGTALLAAHLVEVTRKSLEQWWVILTEIAQQLESLWLYSCGQPKSACFSTIA